jgi:hypothetical protein
MADFEVVGVEAVNRRLNNIQRRLDTSDSGSTLRRVMNRAVLRIQAGMMEYPRQRAGSSYVRTGTLGRRWTTAIETDGNDLLGKVGNNTEYGPFVQSEMYQAGVHKAIWQTDRTVLERERPTIVGEFARLLGDAIRETV